MSAAIPQQLNPDNVALPGPWQIVPGDRLIHLLQKLVPSHVTSTRIRCWPVGVTSGGPGGRCGSRSIMA
jgi:hypothetical protein